MPLATALLAQLVAALMAFGGAYALAALAGIAVPVIAVAVAQGVMAALLGRVLGLAGWWLVLHAGLPPAAVGALGLNLPPAIYLALFLVLLGIFWNVVGDRVPLYLTNRATGRALAGLLPERAGVAFLDLGSGIGGLLGPLARARPDGQFVGIESAPLPFALGWLRRRLFGPANVRLRYGDLWAEPLGAFDVVYAFLSPAPMAELYGKARREMRPGSLFISNSFAVPGAAPDRVIEVADRRRTRLLVWHM